MSAIEMHSALRSRVLFFYGVIGFFVLILFGGLAYRQLFSSEAFQERERLQNQRRILTPGPRGEIYDREGRVLVANRPRFSAVLYFSDEKLRAELRRVQFALTREYNAGKIDKPPGGLSALARATVVQRYHDLCARILGRDESIDLRALERHFAEYPLLPYPVVDELSPPEFAALLEQIPVGSPLQIYASTMRHYPYGSAAAHTLGYVKATIDLPGEKELPGADLRTFPGRGSYGESGLERQFDQLLQGKTGSEIWVVDNRGIQAQLVESQPPVTGQPLHTSLDMDLQAAGEEAFENREGALVLLDVNTGEVLALVSKPDYDLNDFTPRISAETWKDVTEREALLPRAIQGLYPPGSTFKLITAMAALRAGVITPETTFECTGLFRIRPHVCMRRSGHGPMKLHDAIKKSCNIYFYEAALALGPEKLAEEARRFGLDRPTGIELSFEETKNMLVGDPAWKRRARPGESWTAGDTANIAIGQGPLIVTPMQMACFAASLARGETTTKPTLLRRMPDQSLPPSANQSIGLPPALYEQIIKGMAAVVQEEGGTGQRSRIEGIRIAGKSGTAQVRTPRGTLELAWFLAFAPIENPRVAIALVVVGDTPDAANGGGMVAAPVAQKVLKTYFEKYRNGAPPAPSVLQRPLAAR